VGAANAAAFFAQKMTVTEDKVHYVSGAAACTEVCGLYEDLKAFGVIHGTRVNYLATSFAEKAGFSFLAPPPVKFGYSDAPNSRERGKDIVSDLAQGNTTDEALKTWSEFKWWVAHYTHDKKGEPIAEETVLKDFKALLESLDDWDLRKQLEDKLTGGGAGSLNGTETPECRLRSIKDYYFDLDLQNAKATPASSYIEDENSGPSTAQDMGDVLQDFVSSRRGWLANLQEQSWSWKTIALTVAVSVLAITQIVLGAALMFATGGLAASVSMGLIGEGCSDLIWMVSTLASTGHLSWKSYGAMKVVSLALTVATGGIGLAWAKSAGAVSQQASLYAMKKLGSEATQKGVESAVKISVEMSTRRMAKITLKKASEAVFIDGGMQVAAAKLAEATQPSIESLSSNLIKLFNINLENDADMAALMQAFLLQEEAQGDKNANDAAQESSLEALALDAFVNSQGVGQCIEDCGSLLKDALSAANTARSQVNKMRTLTGVGGGGGGQKAGIFLQFVAPVLQQGTQLGYLNYIIGQIVADVRTKLEELVKGGLDGGKKLITNTREVNAGQSANAVQSAKKIRSRWVKAFEAEVSQRLTALQRHFSSVLMSKMKDAASNKLKQKRALYNERHEQAKMKGALEGGSDGGAEGRSALTDGGVAGEGTHARAGADLSVASANTERRVDEQVAKILMKSKSPAVWAEAVNSGAPLAPEVCVDCMLHLGIAPIIRNNATGAIEMHSNQSLKPVEVRLDLATEANGQVGHYSNGTDGGGAQSGRNNCFLDAVLKAMRESGDPELVSKADQNTADELRKQIANHIMDPNSRAHISVKSGHAKRWARAGYLGGALSKSQKNLNNTKKRIIKGTATAGDLRGKGTQLSARSNQFVLRTWDKGQGMEGAHKLDCGLAAAQTSYLRSLITPNQAYKLMSAINSEGNFRAKSAAGNHYGHAAADMLGEKRLTAFYHEWKAGPNAEITINAAVRSKITQYENFLSGLILGNRTKWNAQVDGFYPTKYRKDLQKFIKQVRTFY